MDDLIDDRLLAVRIHGSVSYNSFPFVEAATHEFDLRVEDGQLSGRTLRMTSQWTRDAFFVTRMGFLLVFNAKARDEPKYVLNLHLFSLAEVGEFNGKVSVVLLRPKAPSPPGIARPSLYINCGSSSVFVDQLASCGAWWKGSQPSLRGGDRKH